MSFTESPIFYGDKYKLVFPEDQIDNKIQCGSFSAIESMSQGSILVAGFMYCREFFQDESKGIRKLLISHRQDRGLNIAAFINRVERRLKIEPRSSFGPTSRRTITWIRVSSWWTATSMKRSLLTCLIRAGHNFEPELNNFEEALFSIDYTRKTEYAVRRFLRGYTKYNGKVKGWVSQFHHGWPEGDYGNPKPPDPKKVRELLVRP